MNEAFHLHGVLDRGVPHKERIACYAVGPVKLQEFGVMIGTVFEGAPTPAPVRDQLYWFGNATLDKGDWVYIYTGPGTNGATKRADSADGFVYTVYWDRRETVFHHPSVVPILFRVYTYETGQGVPLPVPSPQLPLIPNPPQIHAEPASGIDPVLLANALKRIGQKK